MEKRFLIARWLGAENQPVPIYDEASVSSARQRVRDVGKHSSLDHQVIESAALIASELTHNQLLHARQGYFSVRPIERSGIQGLELIAADMGPGIEKPLLAIQDKTAGSGSLGAGLGAVFRIADEIEVDNRISEGLCIIARKFAEPVASSNEAAIMGKPFPGEAISGDDGVIVQSASGFLACVSDGLGHGPEARQASNRAIEALTQMRERDLGRQLIALNDELAGTRGCAISVMRFDLNERTLECASVGDVHAHLYNIKDAHFFTSTPMILGDGRLRPQKIRIEKVPVAPGAILIMFTDGLKSRTTLKSQLDVLRQPVIGIAQHLIENYSRPDDDALVLVARFRDFPQTEL